MAYPVFHSLSISPYTYIHKQRPYNYNITLENTDYPADLLLIVNKRDRFKVSSRLLSENCDYFSSQSLEDELEISLPFDSMIYEFLFFLTYEDISVLQDSVKYFHEMLELYILMSTLQYHNRDMYDILNGLNIRNTPNVMQQRMPRIWHRDYVDFDFAVSRVERLMSGYVNGFGYGFGVSVGVGGNWIIECVGYLVTWLGFDSVKNKEEVNKILESQDFKKVQEYLEVKSLYPNNQNELTCILARFPMAIKCFSSTRILERFSLI